VVQEPSRQARCRPKKLDVPACLLQAGSKGRKARLREDRPVNVVPGSAGTAAIPFDQARLDRLMEEAGIDVVLATSKHNVQYLLGCYTFIFFSAMDAIGHSRYLPVVVYEKGRPEHAAYVPTRWKAASTRCIPSGRRR